MQRLTTILAMLAALVISSPLSGAEYKPGEVIVKFKTTTDSAQALAAAGEPRAYTVAVDNTAKAIAELKSRDDVAYVEPNYLIAADAVPNDWPYAASEWEDVGLENAWDFIAGRSAGQTVRIAVVDSGVDLDHPELAAVLLPGYDFANRDSTPEDDAGHGTRVCGIIGAKGNNQTGLAGVAWDIPLEIMPLKFMQDNDGQTTGYTSDAMDAIYYAVDHGAQIINASWGFDSYSRALEDAVRYARNHGVLFVASAGNNGANNDEVAHFPSNYKLDNVIAVAAMNRYGELASFSNYGHYSVHVAAPGSGLKTTDLDGQTTAWASGTSFAAPFVAGIAALVISQSPALSAADVRTRILQGSIMDPDYSPQLLSSGGCVNASNALLNIKVHDLVSQDDWTPPQAQNSDSDSSAGSEGGGGAGCFITTAQAHSQAPNLILLALTLIALFPMRAFMHQE